MSSTLLPLFPLNLVLFPGATLALHIFEERYQLMIGRCLQESLPFGIVLLRAGSEVDPNDPAVRALRLLNEQANESSVLPALPAMVGTTARIAESHRFDDGRYYLRVVGMRRFRIQRIVQHQPYLNGMVAFLTEPSDPELPVLANQVRQLHTRYWQAMQRMTGERDTDDDLADDPIALGYELADRVQVELPIKQRWLEADPATILRELAISLQDELRLIPGVRG